jgi:hypothetical protein
VLTNEIGGNVVLDISGVVVELWELAGVDGTEVLVVLATFP